MKNKLQEILKERDTHPVNSKEWNALNKKKADLLEEMKPSTKEEIITFYEKDLDYIEEGFTLTSRIPEIPFHSDRRALLEHHPLMRHPIPYCIVRYENKYFFILRESGSGEIRLIGKKGMIGGHVGIEDMTDDLETTMLSGLMREVKEEAYEIINNLESAFLKGIIKSNEGVDADHLGLVYEIIVTTDKIDSTEEDKLTGIWIEKEDIENHKDQLESWARIVYENVIKNK